MRYWLTHLLHQSCIIWCAKTPLESRWSQHSDILSLTFRTPSSIVFGVVFPCSPYITQKTFALKFLYEHSLMAIDISYVNLSSGWFCTIGLKSHYNEGFKITHSIKTKTEYRTSYTACLPGRVAGSERLTSYHFMAGWPSCHQLHPFLPRLGRDTTLRWVSALHPQWRRLSYFLPHWLRMSWQNVISQEKIPWNTLSWPRIEPGPRRGQTGRYIHSLPLSYRDPGNVENRQWDIFILLLSYHDPGHREDRQWDSFILPLSYHDLGNGSGQTVIYIHSPTELL